VTRLEEYLAARRDRRFRFGRFDCALFACQWVRLATGRDLRREYGVGRYEGQHQGLALLRAAGFETPVDLARAVLPEVPVLHARVGDLAVVGDALGIVGGSVVYVVRPVGWGTVPLTAARAALRVR
jgi:hypothetical protein